MSAALSFALPAAAQQPTTPQANQLTGMVFNKQGDPLVGAYVRVKQGKKTWTVQTDETGKYVINLPAGQSTAGLSVAVSYIGMQRQVKGTKAGVMHYDFMLEDNSKSLGEAVVTGYGQHTRENQFDHLAKNGRDPHARHDKSRTGTRRARARHGVHAELR